MEENKTETLLGEIRDLQKQSLEEFKRVTAQSLDLQQRAVNRQEQLGKTYRVALIASATLVTIIIGLIIYLLQYLPSRYR